jgi:hypothetical protein
MARIGMAVITNIGRATTISASAAAPLARACSGEIA